MDKAITGIQYKKSITNTRNLSHTLLLTLVLFFYVYNITIPGLPDSFLSRRVAAFLVFVVALFSSKGRLLLKKTKADSHFLLYIGFQFFALFIGLITVAFIGKGSGRSIISNYLETIFFGSMAYLGFKRLFYSIDDFMQICLFTTLLQCMIIIAVLLYPALLNTIISIDRNSPWDLRHMAAYGYAVGLGCVTSTGTMKLSIGLLASFYFISIGKNKKINTLFYIVISVVMSAVARTGIVLSGLGFFAIIILLWSRGMYKTLRTLFYVIIGVVAFYIIFMKTPIGPFISNALRRIIYSTTNRTWKEWFSGWYKGETTIVPPLSMFGELITSGTSSLGHQINVDGGFRKVLFAMGVPLGLFYYGLVTFISLREANKQICIEYSLLIWLFFGFIVCGEFKEFFIFDVYFLVLLMVNRHLLELKKMKS